MEKRQKDVHALTHASVSMEWDPRGLYADPTTVGKYLSELFFKTRCKAMLSTSFVFENVTELE